MFRPHKITPALPAASKAPHSNGPGITPVSLYDAGEIGWASWSPAKCQTGIKTAGPCTMPSIQCWSSQKNTGSIPGTQNSHTIRAGTQTQTPSTPIKPHAAVADRTLCVVQRRRRVTTECIAPGPSKSAGSEGPSSSDNSLGAGSSKCAKPRGREQNPLVERSRCYFASWCLLDALLFSSLFFICKSNHVASQMQALGVAPRPARPPPMQRTVMMQ